MSNQSCLVNVLRAADSPLLMDDACVWNSAFDGQPAPCAQNRRVAMSVKSQPEQCSYGRNCHNRRLLAQNQLPEAVRIANSVDELADIATLRRSYYQKLFPQIHDFESDIFDQQSVVLFSRDSAGKIDCTARLACDGPLGLPEDKWFPPTISKLRESGCHLMELGRFIIDRDDPSCLKNYYRAFYSIAQFLRMDYIVMAMQPRHVAFHRKLIGAQVVNESLGLTYGGDVELVCVLWRLSETNARLFKWIGDSE